MKNYTKNKTISECLNQRTEATALLEEIKGKDATSLATVCGVIRKSSAGMQLKQFVTKAAQHHRFSH
jgi:hypothetical protein